MRYHTELEIPNGTIGHAVDDLSRLAMEKTKSFKLAISPDVLNNLKPDQWIKIARELNAKYSGGMVMTKYIPMRGWEEISGEEVNVRVYGFIEDDKGNRTGVIIERYDERYILGDDVRIAFAESEIMNVEGERHEHIKEVDEWGGDWEESKIIKDPNSVDQEVAQIKNWEPLKMNPLQALKEALVRLLGRKKSQGIEKSLEDLEHYFGAHLLQVDYQKRFEQQGPYRVGSVLNENTPVGAVFVQRDVPQQSFIFFKVLGYDTVRKMVITSELFAHTKTRGEINLELASENRTLIPSGVINGVVYKGVTELLEVLVAAEKNQAELEKGSVILLLQGLKARFSKKVTNGV